MNTPPPPKQWGDFPPSTLNAKSRMEEKYVCTYLLQSGKNMTDAVTGLPPLGVEMKNETQPKIFLKTPVYKYTAETIARLSFKIPAETYDPYIHLHFDYTF